MEIKERHFEGVYEIDLKPIEDCRGFFMRTYDISEFANYCLNKMWVQENHSMSLARNVIRGLHFQFPPFEESKLVRCINGVIMDVFVDLRIHSKTFGQWDSIELSAENKKMVFIPRGFAHGFCTLSKKSEVLYKVDNFYNPNHECGLKWNDSTIGIKWPCNNPIISEKDSHNISFQEFVNRFQGINLSE
jgi:dTDP-4-dehydrorhamnose 3,5-epimerase